MCKAMTKVGRQCPAPAIRGGKLCSLHADPYRAAQLCRKGVSRPIGSCHKLGAWAAVVRCLCNRHTYEGDGREVAAPRNASDVKDLLVEAMAAIRTGKMNPKLGTTLGYLGSSLLKAFEVADLEQRLEQLEESNGSASTSQAARKAG